MTTYKVEWQLPEDREIKPVMGQQRLKEGRIVWYLSVSVNSCLRLRSLLVQDLIAGALHVGRISDKKCTIRSNSHLAHS